MLFLVQRLEVLHVRDVVCDLLWRAHAAENDHDVFQRCGVTHGPRRDGRFRLLCLEQPFRLLRQARQTAALDRLHDDHRLLVLHADLIALPGLDLLVLPVEVVDLKLDILDLRMRRQNLVEQLRRVVVGKANVLRFALCLLLLDKAEGTDLFCVLIVLAVNAVEPVIVEVVHTAARKLLVKDTLQLVRAGLAAQRQLVRDRERIARIALDDQLPERRFALAAMVHIGRVKIGKPGGQIRVEHLFSGLHIDYPLSVRLDLRQAHRAESQFLHISCSFRVLFS